MTIKIFILKNYKFLTSEKMWDYKFSQEHKCVEPHLVQAKRSDQIIYP